MLRFCRNWLIGLLVLIPLMAAFNFAIDPFMVFGSPRFVGINDVKPSTLERAELVKHHLLQRVEPQTLMLGTSKVQLGINPRSPLWPADSGLVFNGGVPGQSLPKTIDEFRDVVARAPLRRVMLLVEITDFMWPGSGATPVGHFLPSARDDLYDRFMASLSLDAFRASISTLTQQGSPYAISMDDDGMMRDGLFRGASDREGASALFEQKFPTVFGLLKGIQSQTSAHPDAPIAMIDGLKDMIQLAREKHIALDIGIAPVHGDFLQILDAVGLWPRYLAAKSAITRAVAEAGGNEVPLWDFIGFDRFSTEPIPAHGDMAHKTQWFWEPNHFKVAIGEKMLETMYHGGTEYGVRLTPQSLDARLLADTAARDRFYAAAPQEHARIIAILGNTR